MDILQEETILDWSIQRQSPHRIVRKEGVACFVSVRAEPLTSWLREETRRNCSINNVLKSQRVLGSTSLLARLLCLVSVSLSVALVDSVHENSE